jgi:hypothetical protein
MAVNQFKVAEGDYVMLRYKKHNYWGKVRYIDGSSNYYGFPLLPQYQPDSLLHRLPPPGMPFICDQLDILDYVSPIDP